MRLLKLPTWTAIVLSVIAGVLQFLNLATFGLGSPWTELVTVGVSALAALGIAPLTGPALQTVLHISHAAALALATVFSTASVAVTTISGLDSTAKGIIVGVLALVAGVLFGASPVPAAARPAPGPKAV